jgi:excisionase family DNA binding protein
MYNPFDSIETRLSNIESLLLDLKHKPKEAENKLHSVKSLASLSGVSELTVRNWIKEGKIQAKKMGGRILIEQTQFANGLEEVKSLKYKR